MKSFETDYLLLKKEVFVLSLVGDEGEGMGERKGYYETRNIIYELKISLS